MRSKESNENETFAENKLSVVEKEKLVSLYEENGRIARNFLDWRHRVMNRFFITIGTLFFVAGWLYDNQEMKSLFILFFIASFISLVSFLMDRVNSRNLRISLEVGSELEYKMAKFKGVYGRSVDWYKEKKNLTYSKIFKGFYLLCAIIFFGIALFMKLFIK